MITSILLQNTISVILTIAIISTILMSITIEKRHKRFLNIPFDFESSKDSITFINHISHRDKFKRLKHSLFINQDKFKRLRNFTPLISSNIS